jgi:hypothetical protein
MVGNTKVGKTSLLNCLIGRKLDQNSLTPTIGIEYAPLNIRVGQNDIRVNIWDTCTSAPTQPARNSTSPSPAPTTVAATEPS